MGAGVHSRRSWLLASVAAVAGCGRRTRKVIAVIPKGTSHLFWISVQTGVLAAGKELGVDIDWNGPNQETEYSRQIEIMDSMIARHVDGIAVAASDRKALLGSLNRASAPGIPVPAFGSGADER